MRKLYSAFGQEKTLPEWSRDRRCKVGYSTLCTRIRDLKWRSFQQAITLPPNRGRKTLRVRGYRSPESGAIPAVLVGVDTCPRCLTMASLYSGGPHFRLCLDCILGRD